MLTTELLAPEREQEYSNLILKDERVLFNSSLKFRELLRKVTGAIDLYLVAMDNDKIVGALPAFLKNNNKYGNVLNSLPWYGSNPGITVDPSYPNRAEVKIRLLNAFEELAQEREVVASTIITRPFELDEELYRKYTKFDFLDSRIGMIANLPFFSDTIDTDLMDMLHSKTRNMVRKAQNTGMKFYHDNSPQTMNFLFDTHHKNMLEIGAPAKSRDFFESVSKIFTYDIDYRIYIAVMGGIKVAALLLKYFAKTVEYFTPAIVPEYRCHQPLSILIYMAMKDAAEKGMRYWNWGGTSLSSQGVYRFKKRWGSQESPYYYYTHSYANTDKLLSLSQETLLNEYPYFYVVPFSTLKKQNRSV